MSVVGRAARRRRDASADDALPIPPGPVSNGEFVPAPATAADHALTVAMRAAISDAAHRTNTPRRTFLRTAGALAASLAVLDACARSESPKGKGGAFRAPKPEDAAACAHVLGGDEFIFDVHTHHVMPDAPWRQNAPDTVRLVEHMLPPGCRSTDPLDCVDRNAYVHDVFLSSDTTMAMLTDVPNSGARDAPVPLLEEFATRDFVAQLAGAGEDRLMVNSVIAPNVGAVEATLDAMSAAAADGVAAFKVYTAWSPEGRGYSLQDPAIGLPVVQHAHDLGVKVLVAHKGLPLVHFDRAHNGPEDVLAVSRLFPDMQFVVFHAGWDAAYREGPYRVGSGTGIDRLITAMDEAGVPPNSNVWVDVATVWRQVMTRPNEAAHVLGKLLARVGESRVLWGTDAVWYGSPQAQIAALRAFEITPEFQARFGYPALSADVKAKIFGRNAAALFGVDPNARRCGLDEARATAAAAQHEGAVPPSYLPRGPATRRDVLSWLASPATRWRPL